MALFPLLQLCLSPSRLLCMEDKYIHHTNLHNFRAKQCNDPKGA